MANERINGENFSIVVHPFQVTLGCGRLTKKKKGKQTKETKQKTNQTDKHTKNSHISNTHQCQA